MSLGELFVIFLFVLIGIILWQNAGMRERALRIASQHCEKLDVQLLDQSVFLNKMTFGKDQRGNVGLVRSYAFEFTSTGEKRYNGRLKMLGPRLTDIELEPHRMQEPLSQSAPKRDSSHLHSVQ